MPIRTLRSLSLSAALLAAAALPPTAGAAVALSPLVAGLFQAGSGLDARFAQIHSGWQGSTVLWGEEAHAFGSGVAIGTQAWGTGLWGRADWQAVQDAWAAGGPPADAPALTRTWAGRVGRVNFSNAVYNALYSATWGPAALVPFFEGDAPPANPATLADEGWIAHYQGVQDNWTAHFTGLLRVTRPGAYDLSVLNDDGFFLRLTGGDDQALEIGRDFLNPRDRTGFADSLWLDAGLYGLELGMWNRLEAGVVDLRWSLDGGQSWELVPTAHLLPSIDLARPVPAPATLALALLALGVASLSQRRRRAA